ncbi:MAG: DUF4358 domain-containing protein [Oscillospiraceae bacterium]|jgi:hypothetical protein|nr:DUF4358 domain-containing protein [Oscillospiraceae bacterium]
MNRLRKAILTALALALILTLSSCAGKFDDPQKIIDDALASGAFSETLEPVENAELMYSNFGLNSSMVESAIFYMSSGATSETIVYLKAKASESMYSVALVAKARVVTLKNSESGYRPEEIPKLDNARVIEDSKSRVVILIVANDYSKLPEVLRDAPLALE